MVAPIKPSPLQEDSAKGILFCHIFFCFMQIDALLALLRRAKTNQLLHGAQICRGAPQITHLFFADYSLIFGRANLDNIKLILHAYELASGQKVNFDKSEVSFSKGVTEHHWKKQKRNLPNA